MNLLNMVMKEMQKKYDLGEINIIDIKKNRSLKLKR